MTMELAREEPEPPAAERRCIRGRDRPCVRTGSAATTQWAKTPQADLQSSSRRASRTSPRPSKSGSGRARGGRQIRSGPHAPDGAARSRCRTRPRFRAGLFRRSQQAPSQQYAPPSTYQAAPDGGDPGGGPRVGPLRMAHPRHRVWSRSSSGRYRHRPSGSPGRCLPSIHGPVVRGSMDHHPMFCVVDSRAVSRLMVIGTTRGSAVRSPLTNRAQAFGAQRSRRCLIRFDDHPRDLSGARMDRERGSSEVHALHQAARTRREQRCRRQGRYRREVVPCLRGASGPSSRPTTMRPPASSPRRARTTSMTR